MIILFLFPTSLAQSNSMLKFGQLQSIMTLVPFMKAFMTIDFYVRVTTRAALARTPG